MPAVELAITPLALPHRGLTPIGCWGMWFEADAAQFLSRLAKVEPESPATLADMHRLAFIGQAFTKANILTLLRMSVGRTSATWIEGMIEMLAAEEAAQKPEDQ